MKKRTLVLLALCVGMVFVPLLRAQAITCLVAGGGGCLPPPTVGPRPTANPFPSAAPTSAPTATPAPAPVASAATPTEMAAFLALAPSAPPVGSWALDEYAVSGTWALVGYYNQYSGMTALLQLNSNGTWSIVQRTGGQLLASDLVRLAPAMPTATAQALYSLALSQDH